MVNAKAFTPNNDKDVAKSTNLTTPQKFEIDQTK